MSRKSRMADLREMKDKRMKKIAIGGAVLLAAVLAYEMPQVLHRGGASSSPPPAATTTSSAPTTTPPGTAAAGILPTAGTANTRLPNSDVAPKRSKSQLYSFTHFSGKDPFVQQVVDPTQGLPDGAAAPSTGGAGGKGKGSLGPVDLTSAKSPLASSVRTLAANGAVKIQVNGKIQTVRVGGSFPSLNPLFRLVSIGRGSVSIGIANGSYASGAHTVALMPGRTLTLVDTADGIRYKIRLLTA
jgi:hypothetical protein